MYSAATVPIAYKMDICSKVEVLGSSSPNCHFLMSSVTLYL